MTVNPWTELRDKVFSYFSMSRTTLTDLMDAAAAVRDLPAPVPAEVVAKLRRALEIVMDWYGSRLSVSQFHDKWSPPAMSAVTFAEKAYSEALAATADWQTGDGHPTEACRAADADNHLLRAQVEALTKDRDEAQSKLATAQKELADIYAAKPGSEFRAMICNVQRRDWCHFAECKTSDKAQRIADALNAGGGK